MAERIDVPICKDCYEKKHFTGRLWTNVKQEDDKLCVYCKKVTCYVTEGYRQRA